MQAIVKVDFLDGEMMRQGVGVMVQAKSIVMSYRLRRCLGLFKWRFPKIKAQKM